jgi:hypothetical protein
VEKVLRAADVSTAEAKDAVIDELRPAFAPDVLPPSALREELTREVAERLDLAPSMVSSWLAAGAPPRRAAPPASEAAGPAAPPARPRPADAPEREFLAMCIALPTSGPEALRAVDSQRDFSSPLLRRAHAHLLAHLAAPADGIAGDDEELRALIAELVLTAGAEEVNDRQLRALRVQLELRGVERELTHAPAGTHAGLARRRIELQGELARAMQG